MRNEDASTRESEPNSQKNSVHDEILLFDAYETYLSWEREIPDTRERLYTPSISSLKTFSLHVRGQRDVLMQMEEKVCTLTAMDLISAISIHECMLYGPTQVRDTGRFSSTPSN